MPILFMAVQCVQCSTMQVKQQKKSSNKWVCVVCNQRQSVMRIHARGHIAREIRSFVQQFNISRMKEETGFCDFFPVTSDEYHSASVVGRATPSSDESEFPAKRRTDWSEFLDPEEEDRFSYDGEDFDSGTLLSPVFTTELPTKKLNPTSTKRRAVEHKIKPLEKFPKNLNVEGINYKSRCATVEKKSRTRWSEYLDDDDEEEDGENVSGDAMGDLHPSGDCSRVEDEVHPDFI